MNTKEHYDKHLGNFYSWMTGDFHIKANEFKSLLTDNFVRPTSNKIAIDLGAGHGLQSIPLAELGFQVLAVDFNQQLLDELNVNAKNLHITIINDDIKNVEIFADTPELIICCGDTLSHLDNKNEVKTFIENSVKTLEKNGKIILSFRDYSNKLTGIDRFIPVKSDDNKILTCILDYEDEFVYVTDLLHERIDDVWQQKVSTYKKVRLLASEVIEQLEANGMIINFNQIVNRLTTILASKE
ncbi:MAG: class I SAM-dependent methyltransferase [Bacteroidia bacterium]|jgi:SAM-dependent methyltransferase|nr:class I SAM-dependent methyltransferase [Bacteroidia bacterium]